MIIHISCIEEKFNITRSSKCVSRWFAFSKVELSSTSYLLVKVQFYWHLPKHICSSIFLIYCLSKCLRCFHRVWVPFPSNAFIDVSDVFLGFRSHFAFNAFLDVFWCISQICYSQCFPKCLWCIFRFVSCSFNAFLDIYDVFFRVCYTQCFFECLWCIFRSSSDVFLLMFLIYFLESTHSMLSWMSMMFLHNGFSSIQCFFGCL